ncbi:MAG: hypothetical protein ACE5PT_14280 [Gemmatimonadales bacterium]
MYEYLTPEERLQRVARLLVKAMYLYVGQENENCEGAEVAYEGCRAEAEDGELPGAGTGRRESESGAEREFRSRRIGEIGRGQGWKAKGEPRA